MGEAVGLGVPPGGAADVFVAGDDRPETGGAVVLGDLGDDVLVEPVEAFGEALGLPADRHAGRWLWGAW